MNLRQLMPMKTFTPDETLKKLNQEIYELQVYLMNSEPDTPTWREKKRLWEIKISNRDEVKEEISKITN